MYSCRPCNAVSALGLRLGRLCLSCLDYKAMLRRIRMQEIIGVRVFTENVRSKEKSGAKRRHETERNHLI
jgi:hypothetical protein